ncbi:MAG: response regulator transcription factor, partial [Clostridiaceae bacterium]
MSKIRVFLADDHKILRESLVILLSQKDNIEVVGAAGDGQEAYRKILELQPDIAVLDISIPRLNGLDLAERLRTELPGVKVVILTMHKSGEFVSKALCAGVRGYVLKDNALEELIECIELVYTNKIYLSQDITGIVVEGFVHNSRDGAESGENAISSREREILQLRAEGKSNKDISDLLNLSIKTVETHRANIMRKMNFKNITDLVLYAVRNHIIE